MGKLLVFAAGNHRWAGHQAGQDSLKSHIKSIVVGAHENDGTHTYFTEAGSNVLVTAPGKDLPYVANGTTYTGSGTSYAAPIVSGVIALMLEANPELGWRDVQEIITLSAKKLDMSGSNSDHDWIENAAVNWNGGGNYFNIDYGFGGIDASAAVHLAENWIGSKTTANMQDISAKGTIADGSIADNASKTFDIDFSGQKMTTSIKSASVSTLMVLNQDRRIELISPDGTTSMVLEEGIATTRTSLNFEFTSNAFWGEFGWRL